MFQWIKQFGKTLYDTYGEWSADGGATLAASVAYYTAATFFPLLLVLLSVVGFVLEATQLGQDAQAQVLNAIGEQFSPALQDQVSTVIEQIRRKASTNGPLGLALLSVLVLVLFVQIDTAFNRIWNVRNEVSGIWGSIKQVLLKRLRAFLMLTSLILLIGVVFISGLAISALERFTANTMPLQNQGFWAIQVLTSFALNAVVFCLLYRWVPNVHVPWSAALWGGLLAAFIWEVGRYVLAEFVIGQRYNDAYGVVGAFLAIMLWAYYGAMVILFGAEFAQTLQQRQNRSHSTTKLTR